MTLDQYVFKVNAQGVGYIDTKSQKITVMSNVSATCGTVLGYMIKLK
jgi:hypothetical protein